MGKSRTRSEKFHPCLIRLPAGGRTNLKLQCRTAESTVSAVELLTIFNGFAVEIFRRFEGGNCRTESPSLPVQISFSLSLS